MEWMVVTLQTFLLEKGYEVLVWREEHQLLTEPTVGT